jgi:hypothetical protein
VEAGDDFDNIAARYGVSVEELIAVNGFTKSQPLGEGEMLRIPVTPTPGPNPGQAPSVVIDSVSGPGDLELEQVNLIQIGAGEISLAGWQMDDGQGNVYTFPVLDLASDGAKVSVSTKAGADSVGRLFWGLTEPIWKPGSTVILRDAQGVERSTFVVH